MTTVEEARQQIAQQRQSIATARSQNETARSQIGAVQGQLTSQQNLRSGGGIQALQQRKAALERISTVGEEIGEREKQLESAEASISSYESEVNQVAGQIQAAEQEQADYKNALRAFTKGGAAIFSLDNRRQREIYRELQEGKEDAVQKAVSNVENQLQQSLAPQARAEVEAAIRGRISGKTNDSQFSEAVNIAVSPNQISEIRNSNIKPSGTPSKLPGTVSSVEPLRERFTILDSRKGASIAQDINTAFEMGTQRARAFLTNRNIISGEALIQKGFERSKIPASPGAILTGAFFFPIEAQPLQFLGKQITKKISGEVIEEIPGALGTGQIFTKSPISRTTVIGEAEVQPFLFGERQIDVSRFKNLAITPPRVGSVQTQIEKAFNVKPTTFEISPQQIRPSIGSAISEEGQILGGQFTTGLQGRPQATRRFDIVSGGSVQIEDPRYLTRFEKRALKSMPLTVFPEDTIFYGIGSSQRRIFKTEPVTRPTGFQRTQGIEGVQKLPGKPLRDDQGKIFGFTDAGEDLFFSSKGVSGDVTFNDLTRTFTPVRTITKVRKAIEKEEGTFFDLGKGEVSTLNLPDKSPSVGRRVGADTNPSFSSPKDSSDTAQQTSSLISNIQTTIGQRTTNLAQRSQSNEKISVKPYLASSRNKPVPRLSEKSDTIVATTSPSQFQGRSETILQSTSTTPKINVRLGNISVSLEKSKQGLKQSSANIEAQVPATATIPVTRTKEATLLKPDQQQRSRLDTGSLLRNRQPQQGKSGGGRPSGGTPVIPRPLKNNSSTLRSALEKSNEVEGFDVITYRGGKPVVLGRNLPKGKALKLGVDETSGSLRASFKLQAGGQTSEEDIDFTVPGNIFRPGKRDASRFVQREQFRLSSGRERGEIQSAKRGRGRPRKLKLL